MRKILLVAVVIFVGYTVFNNQSGLSVNEAPPTTSQRDVGKSNAANEAPHSISGQDTDKSDAVIARAFSSHESNVQISGQGVVTKLLPDDNRGSRHQKFLLKLSSGHMLLIAHNIDLAPRINNLREGDAVQFYGEYEWNEKGGIVHWTHRDPRGSHVDGWLQHQGQKYQ